MSINYKNFNQSGFEDNFLKGQSLFLAYRDALGLGH